MPLPTFLHKRSTLFIIILALLAIAILFFSRGGRGIPVEPLALDTEFDAHMQESAPMGMGIAAEEMMVADDAVGVSRSKMAAQPSIMPPTPGGNLFEPGANRKIIKNGSLTMRVNSAERAASDIEGVADGLGGGVLSKNFYESPGDITSGHMTVKVPSDKFSEALASIKNIGSVITNESVDTQDVTAEFVDLEAQLKNKRAEEQQFVAILERAEDVDDVLKVTRELSRVRGEIERLEGRMNYLSNQTDFSTITVNLTEDTTVLPSTSTWRPWQDAKDAGRALVERSQQIVSFAIVFFISKLPIIIFYLIVAWILYLGARKLMKRFG